MTFKILLERAGWIFIAFKNFAQKRGFRIRIGKYPLNSLKLLSKFFQICIMNYHVLKFERVALDEIFPINNFFPSLISRKQTKKILTNLARDNFFRSLGFNI